MLVSVFYHWSKYFICSLFLLFSYYRKKYLHNQLYLSSLALLWLFLFLYVFNFYFHLFIFLFFVVVVVWCKFVVNVFSVMKITYSKFENEIYSNLKKRNILIDLLVI